MSFIKNLIYKFLNKKISIIYNKRFLQHQNTPKGVFWNSKLSQDLRLNIILDKIIDNSKFDTFTMADIGCGYGRCFEIIKERNLQDKIKYSGFDINKNFISFCKNNIKLKQANFYVDISPYQQFNKSSQIFQGLKGSSLTQIKYVFDHLKKFLFLDQSSDQAA